MVRGCDVLFEGEGGSKHGLRKNEVSMVVAACCSSVQRMVSFYRDFMLAEWLFIWL